MSCQHTLLIHMVQQQWFCSVINTGNCNWMWHIWKLSFGVQRLKLPVAINQLVFLHICLRNITKYAEVKWNIDTRLILDNSDYYYNRRFLKIKGTAAALITLFLKLMCRSYPLIFAQWFCVQLPASWVIFFNTKHQRTRETSGDVQKVRGIQISYK